MPAPDLELFLNEWWGGGAQCSFDWARGVATLASNYLVGGNPLYQISDFFVMYPKFGTFPKAITGAAINNAGAGYAVNDLVAVVQPDASGGTLQVAAVDGGGGITAFAAITPPEGTGTGYSVASGLATTTSGTGTGATVNVTSLSAYNSSVPQLVVQAYVTLASAALQSVRWGETWRIAMALYVAHFLTLYLRSEGAGGTTPQQIAATGLEQGIRIASAAGDVSKANQPLEGMQEWGAFAETTYGVQLVTFARGIAMPNSVYIR